MLRRGRVRPLRIQRAGARYQGAAYRNERRPSHNTVVDLTDMRRARLKVPADASAFLERYDCRIWDLSAFMHRVKQRLTRWHNLVVDAGVMLAQERFMNAHRRQHGETLEPPGRISPARRERSWQGGR